MYRDTSSVDCAQKRIQIKIKKLINNYITTQLSIQHALLIQSLVIIIY